MVEKDGEPESIARGRRLRAGWWAVVPPVFMCLCDQAMVLWGQPKIYWAGLHQYAREGMPLEHWLLAQGPFLFAAGMLAWMLLFSTMILALPRRVGMVLSTAVLLGHTWGTCSWLIRAFAYGYWLCLGLVAIGAWIAVACWERAHRNHAVRSEPPASSEGDPEAAAVTAEMTHTGPDKPLLIVLGVLVLAEIALAGYIPVAHEVFASRTGPLKDGVTKLIAESRAAAGDAFPYRLLRRAGPLLRGAGLADRRWGDVLSEMEDQGIYPAYETRSFFASPWTYHHLLAAKDAHVSPRGLRFDLEIEFSVMAQEGLPEKVVGGVFSELVCRASKGTRVEDIEGEFPPGTFIGDVLRHPDTMAARRTCPFIHLLSVSFGLVGGRAFGYDGVGYQARVELWGDQGGEKANGLSFQAYARPQPSGGGTSEEEFLDRAAELGDGVGDPFCKFQSRNY